MPDRSGLLRNLRVGDIFHARSPNGASMVCLVTEVSDDTISSRRITTQDDHTFDLRAGIELGTVPSRIDCVEPLPADIHKTYMDLDQKYQKFKEMLRNGIEPPLEQCKLTAAEKDALLYISDHLVEHAI